jgi:hypothetical protein
VTKLEQVQGVHRGPALRVVEIPSLRADSAHSHGCVADTPDDSSSPKLKPAESGTANQSARHRQRVGVIEVVANQQRDVQPRQQRGV